MSGNIFFSARKSKQSKQNILFFGMTGFINANIVRLVKNVGLSISLPSG